MRLLLVALGLVLTAVATADIIIGHTAPLGTSLGQLTKLGLEMAFKDVNAAGGMRGHNLTLVALDDKFRPDLIAANFRELVDQHRAIMLASEVGATRARTLGPLAEAQGIPYVGGVTSETLLRYPFKEHYVNVRASFSDEVVALVALMAQNLRVQRIAYLYANATYGILGLEVAKPALAHVGLELVAVAVLGDDEAVLEAMLQAPQPPQAVLVVAHARQIAGVLPLLKAHPRLDPECVFLMATTCPPYAVVRDIPDRQSWRHLYFAQLLPSEDHPTSALARRFRAARAAHNLTIEGRLAFEAYATGRLIASALRHVSGPEFTSRAFLDAVYGTRAFVLDEITLGLYNRVYEGCEALLCGCNSGLRSVFLHTMNHTTGAVLPVAGLPSFHYPALQCSSPIEGIKRPVLFAQLIPASSPVWAAIAREMSVGIAAAFEAANAKGGLNGRPLELIPFEYRGGEAQATAAVLDRYPLAGLLGNVVQRCRPDALRAIPDIAPFCFEATVHDAPAPFSPQVLHLQPTIPLEVMALAHYALQRQLQPVHCMAPATAEGDRFLALCTRTLHHFQVADVHRNRSGRPGPEDGGAWTAKTVKRPRQQPAQPQYANYWAPLTRKRHIPPHPAQPRHTNYWAPRTRKRHQQEHLPQRPTEETNRGLPKRDQKLFYFMCPHSKCSDFRGECHPECHPPSLFGANSL